MAKNIITQVSVLLIKCRMNTFATSEDVFPSTVSLHRVRLPGNPPVLLGKYTQRFANLFYFLFICLVSGLGYRARKRK